MSWPDTGVSGRASVSTAWVTVYRIVSQFYYVKLEYFLKVQCSALLESSWGCLLKFQQQKCPSRVVRPKVCNSWLRVTGSGSGSASVIHQSYISPISVIYHSYITHISLIYHSYQSFISHISVIYQSYIYQSYIRHISVVYQSYIRHISVIYLSYITHISLSLIHIWLCRRIERCRSRWSPYH